MPAVATAGGLPTRLGKYELLLPLAAGGMARIYIGRSTGIGSFERHVVLKLITPERANDHTAVQMFLDEARLAAALNHQNVAQVFEVGEDSGIHYLAMEYVHGQDLRALLAKAGSQGTRIPLELALTVVAGAAAGLNHAHERRGPDGTPLGIVHRDVSPSNIMIGYDGAVKLLDFGIAKATSRSVETQSGIIKGKFAYMAPEQCRGRDVDRRSDVFSLGIILYEISTQHRCFRADSDFDTMHRIVTGDVVRPTRLVQGYPQALEAIVMKALAVDANQRYQSAGLLLEAIESFAISARMAMSTMALGRFMRDMFGEVQEPWLNQNRQSQPLQAKENTISSTDGRSNVAAPAIGRNQQAPAQLDAIPEDEARFPDSDGINAARTVLDLPRDPIGREHEHAEEPAEWNAKAYPALQPQMASTATLPPDAGMRPSYPNLQQAVPLPPPPMSMPVPMAQPTVQPQPVTPPGGYPQQPPPQAFSHAPGSGSHSNASMPAIPSTRHGYASGGPMTGELSYPRYEAPPVQLDPADLQLRPNRRPLFIGLGIVAVGIIIMLVVAFGGGHDAEPEAAPPPDEASGAGSATTEVTAPIETPKPPEKPPERIEKPVKPPEVKVDKPPEVKADKPPEVVANPPTNPENPTEAPKPPENPVEPPKPPENPPEVDDMITISVESDPSGAEVTLRGQKLGKTPLTKKIKRASGFAQMVLHKSGYIDATTRVDLAGDNSKKVDLKKEPPPKHDPPPRPPKPKCQQPGQQNPFDTSCDGKPCPVCTK